MATAYVLYNLKAGNNTNIEDINILEVVLHYDVKFIYISLILSLTLMISFIMLPLVFFVLLFLVALGVRLGCLFGAFLVS